MSIRQESDLSCELLRSTLQDINYRLNNLQHVVPNPHSWKDKIQKEAPIPKLNLRKINSVYKENCIPLKKVTASFGDKIIDQVENINDKSFDDLQKKPQIKMMAEQLPQKQRSHSINCSQQVLRNQNSHSIQFKVSNASRLQNSSDFQQYQSLHQSFEKPLKSSFIGSQQIQVPQRDQSLEYVQPTLIQKPIIIEQQQSLSDKTFIIFSKYQLLTVVKCANQKQFIIIYTNQAGSKCFSRINSIEKREFIDNIKSDLNKFKLESVLLMFSSLTIEIIIIKLRFNQNFARSFQQISVIVGSISFNIKYSCLFLIYLEYSLIQGISKQKCIDQHKSANGINTLWKFNDKIVILQILY